MHALTFQNRPCMHNYIHIFKYTMHTMHVIPYIPYTNSANIYQTYIPYQAMHTQLHTIFICILYMHTRIPHIYTITHIHTKHSKHRYHKYQIYKYISYHISCHFCLSKCPDILKSFEKILTVDTETQNGIIGDKLAPHCLLAQNSIFGEL